MDNENKGKKSLRCVVSSLNDRHIRLKQKSVHKNECQYVLRKLVDAVFHSDFVLPLLYCRAIIVQEFFSDFD